MDKKALKDLESEQAAQSKQLQTISQQLDNINNAIARLMQSLQSEFTKQKYQELCDLEVQEQTLESQYLEARKKLFELRRKTRSTIVSLLKNNNTKVISILFCFIRLNSKKLSASRINNTVPRKKNQNTLYNSSHF
jgi:TolA-binding protein